MKPTKEMIDRFLSWSLPKDFAPDCHISFTPLGRSWPVGTNLLTAEQAGQMLEHVLSTSPEAEAQPVASEELYKRLAEYQDAFRREESRADLAERALALVTAAPSEYSFRCYSCSNEWEGLVPDADCPQCGTTNRFCAENPSESPRAAEPVAFMWQHDETGRVGFGEIEQLGMGWIEANPRLHVLGPLYAAPPAAQPECSKCWGHRFVEEGDPETGGNMVPCPACNDLAQPDAQDAARYRQVRKGLRYSMSRDAVYDDAQVDWMIDKELGCAEGPFPAIAAAQEAQHG